ncbi:hypothetical protein AB1303_14700 [Saccharolobus solfataricus]
MKVYHENRMKSGKLSIARNLKRVTLILIIIGIVLTIFTMMSLEIKSSIPIEESRTLTLAYAQNISDLAIKQNPVYIGNKVILGYNITMIPLAWVNISTQGILAPNLLYNETVISSPFYFLSILKELKIFVSTSKPFEYSVYLIEPNLFSKLLFSNISTSPITLNMTYLNEYSSNLSRQLDIPLLTISINFTVPEGNLTFYPSIVLNLNGNVLVPKVLNNTIYKKVKIPIIGYEVNNLNVPVQLVQLVDVRLFTDPTNWKQVNYTVYLNSSIFSLIALEGNLSSPSNPISLNLTKLYSYYASVEQDMGFEPSVPAILIKYSMTNGNTTFYPYVTVTVNNNFVVENISNNTISGVSPNYFI